MFDTPKKLELDYPELDYDFMPELLSQVTKSQSNQIQIDPVIPFATGLGVIATAAGGRVKVKIADSWIQHPSIYLCPIAESADGKSQVMNKLRQPLNDAESQLQADATEHQMIQTALHEIAQDKLKNIKQSMSGGKSKSKITPATQADLIAALDEVTKTKPDPIPLILVGGDTTPDRLTELLQIHGSLGILDAEGTLFNHLSGKKHNTGASYETILAATSGDQIKTHRIGRGDSVANNPHLTICAAVQPDVWLQLIDDSGAANRGVVGRFIPLVAQTWRGYQDARAIEKYPVDHALNERWAKTVLAIFNNKDQRMLKLTDDGYKQFQQTREIWLKKLGDDEIYLNGFGSRLMGNLITIAMLFTLINNPAEDQFIHDDALEMALALADPLISYRRLSDVLQIERTPELRILDKLALLISESGDVGMPKRSYRIGIRELQQLMKSQKWLKTGGMDAMNSALESLDNKSWIEFDGDSHIIAHPDLVKHHKAKFFATSVPLTPKNATEMPLLAVSIG
jgi:hypothetical protein